MKPVENINRKGSLFFDNPQIGLPHVAANEPQFSTPLQTKPVKETPERFGGAVLAYPKQSPSPCVNLIDQGDELILLFSPADFIDAYGSDSVEVAVLKPPRNRHLHRTNDTVPTGMEHFRNLFPAQPFGPRRQKPSVRGSEMAFASRPWHPFDFHSAGRTVHPPWGIEKKEQNPPQWHVFKTPLPQGIVAGALLVTARADCPAIGFGSNRYLQSRMAGMNTPRAFPINESRLFFDAVQNGFYQHNCTSSLVGFARWPLLEKVNQKGKMGRVATLRDFLGLFASQPD